jgi:hypothetical protein
MNLPNGSKAGRNMEVLEAADPLRSLSLPKAPTLQGGMLYLISTNALGSNN